MKLAPGWVQSAANILNKPPMQQADQLHKWFGMVVLRSQGFPGKCPKWASR